MWGGDCDSYYLLPGSGRHDLRERLSQYRLARAILIPGERFVSGRGVLRTRSMPRSKLVQLRIPRLFVVLASPENESVPLKALRKQLGSDPSSLLQLARRTYSPSLATTAVSRFKISPIFCSAYAWQPTPRAKWCVGPSATHRFRKVFTSG